MRFQLKSARNIDSVNQDIRTHLELETKIDKFINYDINKVVNESDVFDDERQDCEKYRIHGGIEYLSLLNNMKYNSVYNINDYFNSNEKNGERDIYDSFLFYLVKPTNDLHQLNYGGNTCWGRRFEVIAKPSDIEIMNAGFAKNIFNEQKHMFVINKDINISDYSDIFNLPITELYLYPIFIKNELANENLKFKVWDINGNSTYTELNNTNLEIGDKVMGDIVYFNKNAYMTEKMEDQIYEITTYYKRNNVNIALKWNYNPFIPLKLRYFSSILSKTSSNTKSYEELESIPDYALKLDNTETFVWRDILPQGYSDPLTGEGVDYPFNNNARYLFDNLILSIVPDTNHTATKNLFNEIWFETNSSIRNTKPLSDLNDIGKPCL